MNLDLIKSSFLHYISDYPTSIAKNAMLYMNLDSIEITKEETYGSQVYHRIHFKSMLFYNHCLSMEFQHSMVAEDLIESSNRSSNIIRSSVHSQIRRTALSGRIDVMLKSGNILCLFNDDIPVHQSKAFIEWFLEFHNGQVAVELSKGNFNSPEEYYYVGPEVLYYLISRQIHKFVDTGTFTPLTATTKQKLIDALELIQAYALLDQDTRVTIYRDKVGVVYHCNSVCTPKIPSSFAFVEDDDTYVIPNPDHPIWHRYDVYRAIIKKSASA